MKRMYATSRTAVAQATPTLANETRYAFFLTFAVCVVIPHSLQVITAGLLAITATMSLFVLRGATRLSYVGGCYVLGVLVTSFYLMVGMRNGAPPVAVLQTVLIYVLSPLMWMVILSAAIQLIGVERITRYLIVLAWLCCLSVALFFFLYLNYGRGAVTFFIENPNINLTRGFSGATMNVYGSLIFLSAAIFATPEMVEKRWASVALLGALAVAALTSGRSALILASLVGLMIGIMVRHFDRRRDATTAGTRAGWLRYIWVVVPVAGLILLLDRQIEEVDLTVIVNTFWEKLIAGGGTERLDQNAALWQGIRDTNGLGAGHGIGAAVQRNEFYPWRYENVPLAVIFRTGIAGAAVYALPFVIYFAKSIREILAGTLTRHDKFMFAGLVGSVLAAPTNPYIESFIFQWMFILPLLSLESRRIAANGNGTIGY
jgi:hypothetical protein